MTVAERLAAEIRRISDVESPDETLFIGYPRTTPRAAELVSPGLVEALVHATQDRLGPYARFHEPQVRGGPYRCEVDASPGPDGAALRLDFSLIRSEDSAVLLRRSAVAWRSAEAPARPTGTDASAARSQPPRSRGAARTGSANPSQDELRADVARANRGRMPAPEPEFDEGADPEHAPQEPRRLTSIRDIRLPAASSGDTRDAREPTEPRVSRSGGQDRVRSEQVRNSGSTARREDQREARSVRPPPDDPDSRTSSTVEEPDIGAPEEPEDRRRPPGPPPPRSIGIAAPERVLSSWLVEQWPNLKDRTFRSRDGGAVVCIDPTTRAALSVQAQRTFSRDERLRVELDARATEQIRRFRVRAIFLDEERRAVEVTPVIVQELLPNYTTTIALTAASGSARQYVLLVQLAEDAAR